MSHGHRIQEWGGGGKLNTEIGENNIKITIDEYFRPQLRQRQNVWWPRPFPSWISVQGTRLGDLAFNFVH